MTLGILVVLIIVVSSTYAYWQITRTQTTPNDIVAACLSLDLNDADAENTGINLDSAWPISDDEGASLTGYSFTVTNNCDEEINYIVGLNRVEEESANYLLDSSIKLQLDDNSSFTYSDLSDVEYADAENEYTARASKQVSVETIGAKGTNTHTIRIWVSDEAPVEEQSKTFLGQVFITGGQGIEVPECFTIADNGTITGYNYDCGLYVKVPAEINGIQVKQINAFSFVQGDMEIYSLVNEETGEFKAIYYYTGPHDAQQLIDLLKQDVCEDPTTCTLEDMGFFVITTKEEYNAIDWDYYNVELLNKGYYVSENNEVILNYSEITSLDLSESIYLQTIENNAFVGYGVSEDSPLCEGKSIDKYECIYSPLKNLTLPQNGVLTTIGNCAFEGANLGEITIPTTVENIGEKAFEDAGITKLSLIDTEANPSKLTTIGDYAFMNNLITAVKIPSSVTMIGSRAFDNNEGLTTVIIKNTEGNVTIGSNAFPTTATITYNPNYTD